MKDWKSLSYVRWDCKYHLVFVSKYREMTIYGELRTKIGGIIRNPKKVLEIESSGHNYGRSHIIQSLSMYINKHEAISILGRNGE